MLNFIYADCRKQAHFAECLYAECHYAGFSYAECSGAVLHMDKRLLTGLDLGRVSIFRGGL